MIVELMTIECGEMLESNDLARFGTSVLTTAPSSLFANTCVTVDLYDSVGFMLLLLIHTWTLISYHALAVAEVGSWSTATAWVALSLTVCGHDAVKSAAGAWALRGTFGVFHTHGTFLGAEHVASPLDMKAVVGAHSGITCEVTTHHGVYFGFHFVLGVVTTAVLVDCTIVAYTTPVESGGVNSLVTFGEWFNLESATAQLGVMEIILISTDCVHLARVGAHAVHAGNNPGISKLVGVVQNFASHFLHVIKRIGVEVTAQTLDAVFALDL